MKKSKTLKIIILIVIIIAIVGSITLILNKSNKKESKPVEQIKTEEKLKNDEKQEKQENNEDAGKNEKTVEDKKDSEEDKKEVEKKEESKQTKQENTNTTVTNNNQSTQQTQPVIEQPKSQGYTCETNDEEKWRAYAMESEAECYEFLDSIGLYFGKYDKSLAEANASIPAKFKQYYSFISRDVYSYYTYTITETDDEKEVSYTPHLDSSAKYSTNIMNLIGSFESYNSDWENKPAGTYETNKIKHNQILVVLK